MEKTQEIGIFRFSIIAPLVNKTHGFSTDKEYLVFAAGKTYKFQNKDCKFSESCIRNWYQNYKKYGISALEPKTRDDNKQSRKLSFAATQRIESLRLEFPKITGTAIYKKLIEENFIYKNDVSLSTVLRYIRKNQLKANMICNTERKMFEMESANDCWQADTSSGPYLLIDNKKYKTYIIMFTDDKSRMIMGYDIFFNDNAINMQKVFKNAIKTYGKPKRLFVDNGGPYDNKQLSYICASLGVELIHAKVYSPQSKAKQERLFRTLKDGWMNATDWNEFKSLDDVKESLSEFIHNNYINKIHSVTKETPNSRWHNDYKKIIFLDNNKIEESFLHRSTHKVRLDRTIKFNNEYYEVPFKYVGTTIETRYDPNDLSILYLYENNERKEELKIVDKIINSKIKRQQSINYKMAINDDRDAIDKEE